MEKTLFLNDENLSWKAKGILVYILNAKDDRVGVRDKMIEHAKDGVRSTYAGINELLDNGYLSRTMNDDMSVSYHGFARKEDNNIIDYKLG